MSDVYEESLTSQADQYQMPAGIRARAGATLATARIPAYERLECQSVPDLLARQSTSLHYTLQIHHKETIHLKQTHVYRGILIFS